MKTLQIRLVLMFCCLCSFANAHRAIAQTSDCSKEKDTAMQSECARLELKRAESEMQKAFDSAIAGNRLSAEDYRQTKDWPAYDKRHLQRAAKLIETRLRASQKAWLSYREAACGAVEAKYDGGTITETAVLLCKVDSTKERSKFLIENFSD